MKLFFNSTVAIFSPKKFQYIIQILPSNSKKKNLYKYIQHFFIV